MATVQKTKKDTKTAIMDAAEIVMAEHGVDGATISQIVSEAGANIAAVHYHFNSREGLVEATLTRHKGFVAHRLKKLIEELDESSRTPTPMDIANIIVNPRIDFLLEKGEAARRSTRFLARLQFDRRNQSDGKALHDHMARKHFPEIRVRMYELMERACPDLGEAERRQRLTMAFDILFHYLANAEFMKTEWNLDGQHEEMLQGTANLKSFIAGGLGAPSTRQEDQTEKFEVKND
jgi:AcrR family transcriptional regulator